MSARTSLVSAVNSPFKKLGLAVDDKVTHSLMVCVQFENFTNNSIIFFVNHFCSITNFWRFRTKHFVNCSQLGASHKGMAMAYVPMVTHSSKNVKQVICILSTVYIQFLSEKGIF